MEDQPALSRVETPYGVFFADERRDRKILKSLRERGAQQPSDLAMALSFVRSGDTVLDIGANIGSFSIPLARAVGEHGTVHAFEAMPDAFALLTKNIRENNLSGVIRAHQQAVADAATPLFADVTPDRGGTSLLDDGAGEHIMPTTLDIFFDAIEHEHISFVKIDTEGMEHRILKGARKMLEKNHPVLLLEVNVRQLHRHNSSVLKLEHLLRSYGYTFFKNFARHGNSSGEFELGRLVSIYQGGPFFDLLAIPQKSDRLPGNYLPVTTTIPRSLRNRAQTMLRRFFA